MAFMKSKDLFIPLLLAAIALSPVPVLSQVSQAAILDRIEAELADKDRNVSEGNFKELEGYLETNPRDSRAHLYMGMILERMGLKEQALPQLRMAVEYGPDNPDALVELCKKEISEGRPNTAIGLLNEGIRKFPKNPKILFMVGEFLTEQKEPGFAKDVLERAMAMDRDHTLIGLPTSLARINLDLNLMRAVLLASMDLKKLPGYDRALRVRGVAYKRLGRHRDAVNDLSKVFAHDPNVLPLDDALSESYYWLGEYKNALDPALYIVALTAAPDIDNPIATGRIARIMKKLPPKELESILDDNVKMIQTRLETLDVFYYQVGTALDKINRPDLAMEYYRKAIAANPELVGAYYRLGVDLELYKKDLDGALEYYTRAHNLRPWDNEIGLAQMRLNDRIHNRDSDIASKWKHMGR